MDRYIGWCVSGGEHTAVTFTRLGLRREPCSLAAAILLAAAACTPAATLTPTPPAYVDIAEIAAAPLGAGSFSFAALSPRIIVTVPRGWRSFHHEDRFWDVARQTDDGLVVVFFQRPTIVYGPPLGGSPATPQEAVELVAQNPGLTVSESNPMEVDGYAGLRVDLAAAQEDTQVLAAERPLLGIGPDVDVRLAFFSVEDGILVIGLISPKGKLEETVERLQPILDSIWIEEDL
jgi:hypothetical protein